jgi:N-6 DNA Methylase
MQKRQQSVFITVHSEGTLFTGDMLQQIAKRATKLEGLTQEDYHLLKSAEFNDVITRAWEEALKIWSEYTRDIQAHPERHLALTREWMLKLLPLLNYGRLLRAEVIQTPQRSYAISHSWHHVPIHLVSSETPLDKSIKSSADTPRSSPYSLVQDLLNNVDGHLWGMISNGNLLRLLRKNVSLTRQAYIEFDLEAMMKGEVYADFVLFWLLCHQSRLETEKPEDCWLEKWLRLSHENGIRALDKLRDGVQQAIEILGTGFLKHPLNRTLHDKLRDGILDTQDYYRQVLRLVYRLIIVFVAEDRQILFHPAASEQAIRRYKDYYSTARLRRLAERRIGTQHSDLYQSLALVMRLLGAEEGCLNLGLFALNGFLFSDAAMPDLTNCQLTNQDLLDAIRALAFIRENNVQLPVDYLHLGSEELGSVYESLLELVPVVTIGKDATVGEGTFALQTVSGNERKTTGSYYTPTSLIDCLLDSALEPVLQEACRKADPEKAILNLKVCDPACGSGHFLVAAAYRIAKRLASMRSGDIEPPAEVWREALRNVIGHCIYGVDINPMSVELCKVRLWLEAINPGKPFSFLDSHILEGNSLLGTTPALLEQGIPDSAFEPIEGDDKKISSEYKKKNREQRTGQLSLFDPMGHPWENLGNLATSMMKMDEIRDDTVKDYHRKQAYYEQFVHSADYLSGQLLADAWCAAFVWKKNKEFAYPITHEIFRKIQRNPYDLAHWMREEIIHLRKQYKFFHWHLEFPRVFRVPTNDEEPENAQTGWCGGFDVVLGNPPWGKVKTQEREWFINHNSEIANTENAAQRQKLIDALALHKPTVYAMYLEDRRKLEGESHFIRDSSIYPLCGRGDVNYYAIFTENMRSIINSTGRSGCIVQSGIATDDTTKFFFQDIIRKKSLVSFYDFKNRKYIFPAVESTMKFCLLTLSSVIQHQSLFSAQLDDSTSLTDPTRIYSLSSTEIEKINPNTLNCPTFSSAKDAEIVKGIHNRMSIFIKDNTSEKNIWDIKLSSMFHMTSSSHLFRTLEDLLEEGWSLKGNFFLQENKTYLPLYESKFIDQFNHRSSTFNGIPVSERFRIRARTKESSLNDLCDPDFRIHPRYWIAETEIYGQIPYTVLWELGFRNAMSAVADSRSLIAAIVPIAGVGNSMPLVSCGRDGCKACILLTGMNSFVLDYVVRQKNSGGNLNFYIFKQLPFPCPEVFFTDLEWIRGNLANWISPRALELTYTSWDLEPFAKDCAYNGPPFRWHEERRFLLRCELDAAYFHLYGIERDDVDYIMETFPIVKRKDEKQYGDYRTKRVILAIYDEIKRAMETGEVYQTRLNPPPADPSVAHPPKEEMQV